MKNTLLKYRYIILLSIIIFPFLLILISNYWIEKKVANKTFNNPSEIKHNKVGLLLGTSKDLKNGHMNLYFKYRVDAATELFNQGKIDFILVSGDNSTKEYNECEDFKNELIKKGIPENKIFLDFAGFRTLDSVVRCKKVFGETNITIISQQFHNERAIYLAEQNGMDAIAFNAQDITGKYGLKVQLREYLARTKVFIDLLLGIQPKFLGAPITIE